MSFLPKNFTSPTNIAGEVKPKKEVKQRPIEAYFESDYISNSQLSVLDCLCKGQQPRETPQGVFEFGSAFDCFVTEREKWNPDLYDLQEFHFKQIEAMALLLNAKKRYIMHHDLTNYQTEHFRENFEVCEGLKVKAKCKTDLENRELNHIFDIKTTTCKTLREFYPKIFSYNYDRAAAWYLDVTGAGNYSLLVCNYTNKESELENFEHEVWQIDFTPQMLQMGRDEYRRILIEAKKQGLI